MDLNLFMIDRCPFKNLKKKTYSIMKFEEITIFKKKKKIEFFILIIKY